MIFPGVMLVDYVRVYQRTGETNIGCDPSDYPTADYIQRHPDTYGSKFFVVCVFFWGGFWFAYGAVVGMARSQSHDFQLPNTEERTCQCHFIFYQ
jgi:Beta-glucan synthesis-associated protein SKN1/KRE6/Sbg1